jgi:hypothetical protein
VNKIELASLDVADGEDQNIAQTSLCEGEEGTDETKLLGREESENRTSNLLISNSTSAIANDSVINGMLAEEEEEEVKNGVQKTLPGDEEDEPDKEMQGSRRSHRVSTLLSTLKNSLLDLRLFFW